MIPIRLMIDRNGMLQDTEIHFEVLQDYSLGVRGGETIILGNVKLNLAEYVNQEYNINNHINKEEDEGGIARRYLMQDSRINSTLKVRSFLLSSLHLFLFLLSSNKEVNDLVISKRQ